jgi:hypothetical protein
MAFNDWNVYSWSFVSFLLDSPVSVPASDFYPPLPATPTHLAIRRFGGAACANGSAASTCVDFKTVDLSSPALAASVSPLVFTAPASDASNITGGTNYAPTLTTVWPLQAPSPSCTDATVATEATTEAATRSATPTTFLLGDLRKYVPTSTVRFTRLRCVSSSLLVTVHGSPGEVVPVSSLKGQCPPVAGQTGSCTIAVVDVTIPKEGTVDISLS